MTDLKTEEGRRHHGGNPLPPCGDSLYPPVKKRRQKSELSDNDRGILAHDLI